MDGATPNFKTWNILYPVYINSKKTIAEGRRISAAKACENPTALEIGDCCGHLKVPFAIEIDKYTSNFLSLLRFMLKKPDGSLHNPLIASKKQLMIKVAELVPRHPGRMKKLVLPRHRSRCKCSSTPGGPVPGENESKQVLDAFFLGKAFAEALNERVESAVGEFLSTVGRVLEYSWAVAMEEDKVMEGDYDFKVDYVKKGAMEDEDEDEEGDDDDEENENENEKSELPETTVEVEESEATK